MTASNDGFGSDCKKLFEGYGRSTRKMYELTEVGFQPESPDSLAQDRGFPLEKNLDPTIHVCRILTSFNSLD
jgi:hypothetical protein